MTIINANNMTLSVVLCTYNGERFLREQLDSVLSQTLMPDEIVVSDDCSYDNTWSILLNYKQKHPSLFKLYRNEKNCGVLENFRKAFHYASSELVAICDQDDIWMPSKLELSVELMEKTGAGVVCCCEQVLKQDGRVEVYNIPQVTTKNVVFNAGFRGHLMVCRKEMLDACYVSQYICYDGAISLYAIASNKLSIVNMVGCIWRRHDKTVTTDEVLPYENLGKWSKWTRAMKMIMMGKRSDSIARLMNATALILDRTIGMSKENQLFAKMARMMERQSFISMLVADWLYMRATMLSDDFNDLRTREKLGRVAYAFRFPTVWWYD